MRLCDICKTRVELGGDLTRLRPRFQTKEIKEVCDACHKRLNKEKDQLQAVDALVVTEQIHALMLAWANNLSGPVSSPESEDALVQRIQDKMLSDGVLNRPVGRFRRLVRWLKCH